VQANLTTIKAKSRKDDFLLKISLHEVKHCSGFDLQEQLIAQQGKAISTLPFPSREALQVQLSEPQFNQSRCPFIWQR
jgi:hypothetical protein